MFDDPLVLWLVYILVGSLMLLALLRLPEKTLLWFGRYISPNWVSVVHTPLVWIAYFILYKQGYFFLSLQLMTFSAALDRIDGRMAAVLSAQSDMPIPKSFWGQMDYRGATPYGKIVDPLMDKAAVFPIYLDAGYRFILGMDSIQELWLFCFLMAGAVLIGFMLLVEVFGQLIRLDYFSKWRKQKDNAATWVGKVKALAQWIWLIFFPIWDQGWLTDEYKGGFIAFLNALLALIVVLAVMSLISKLRPVREGWTRVFSHKSEGK